METLETISTYELERGKPMPSENHAFVQTLLTVAFFQYKDRYKTFSELSLDLDGRHFVPDLCVYPQYEVDWQHDNIRKTEPPLMVVEILSPTQGMQSLVEKADAYFEAGVQGCWIVQPALEAIAVFEPNKKPKVYTEGEIRAPATEIVVTLEEIFQP